MLFLYHGNISVCSQKVRLALAEKGLAWEGKILELSAGEQFDPEYMKLNPNAVIPTLVDDGRVVIESNIIDEYLDDAYPDPSLTPVDAYDRARMRLWTKQLDDGIHYAINAATFAIALRKPELEKTADERQARIQSIPDPVRRGRMKSLIEEGMDSPLVDAAVARLDKMLGDMDDALGAAPWLAGAEYSLADIAFTPYLNRMDMLHLSAMWEDRRPRVTEWFIRIKARPSFAAAIAKWDLPQRVKLMNASGASEWLRIKAKLAGA